MKRSSAVIVALLILVLALFVWITFFPEKHAPAVTLQDPSALPGLQTGDAPWPAEITQLAERLRSVGEPALSMEGAALHIHQHLDIFIDGQSTPVPANIGIAATFISPIHTHDDTGIIHVESPTVETFTLGQLFDIWGVRFTSSCIGGYCADATHTLSVYINGSLASGDPRQLALAAHQEIAIIYGTKADVPKNVPASYDFPEGY